MSGSEFPGKKILFAARNAAANGSLFAFVNGMVYGVCCMLTNTSEGVFRGAGHCTVDGPQKWTDVRAFVDLRHLPKTKYQIPNT